MEPLGRADAPVGRRSCEVRADMLADDVADFGGASGARPWTVTMLLWVPAVWTTRLAVPNILSSGPRVTSRCWTRTNGTIVSVWNSQPRTLCSMRSVRR